MIYLDDVQLGDNYIVARWGLGEDPGSLYVYDDVGGIELIATGVPTLGLPSISNDSSTSSLGGSRSSTPAGFEASVSLFDFTAGSTVGGVTCADPAGGVFNLFDAPGQASLVITGTSVQWKIWTTVQHVLTAYGAVTGPPQYVLGVYDPVAEEQTIWVDGSRVAWQPVSGDMAEATTGETQVLTSSGTNVYAAGQHVAVYNGALPQTRITQHYQAFAQTWQNPGIVDVHPSIGVAS